MEKTSVLSAVCTELARGDLAAATDLLNGRYPFCPQPRTLRRYTLAEMTQVFVRDGFVDRYTGERLVFPPVLHVLSAVLPEAFPFHRNWKTEATHPAYWDLTATLDHLEPVCRGGADNASNWVTTSMARNSAKSNWTVQELGWTLYPAGNVREWDGLLAWFVEFTASRPGLTRTPIIREWRRAAMTVDLGG